MLIEKTFQWLCFQLKYKPKSVFSTDNFKLFDISEPPISPAKNQSTPHKYQMERYNKYTVYFLFPQSISGWTVNPILYIERIVIKYKQNSTSWSTLTFRQEKHTIKSVFIR